MKKLLLIFLFFGCTIAYSQGKDTTNLKLQQQVDILGQQIELLNKELGISKETIASLNVKVKEVKSESKEETDYYLSHITLVLMFVGFLITFLAAVIGIGGPLFFNSNIKDYISERIADFKEEVTEAKKEINKITKIVEDHVEDLHAIKDRIDKQEISVTKSVKDNNEIKAKIGNQEITVTELAKQAKISELFSEANNDKSLDERIMLYDEALKLDPDNASAHYNKGLSYSRKGKYAQAVNYYNKAIAKEDNNKIFYNNRGIALAQWGHMSEAIADLNIALDIDPKYTDAHVNMGNIYFVKDEYEKAAENFNKAIEIDKSLIYLYNILANTYCQDNGKGLSSDVAILYINEAIEFEPKEPAYQKTKYKIYLKLAEQENEIEQKIKYQEIADKSKAIYDELSKVEKYSQEVQKMGRGEDLFI